MNKCRNLKLFGLVSVLTFALVFIGFHLFQAQAEAKDKPSDKGKGKPKEEVYWSVIIPNESPNMLRSDPSGHEFVSNEKDWISLIKLGYSPGGYCHKGGKRFYYQINFWIHGPDCRAGFQDVNFPSFEECLYQYNPCTFPFDYLNGSVCPYCLEYFLNKLHPHPEYTSFRIYFMIHDFDIENMEPYGFESPIVDLTNYEGHYGFSIWHSSVCSPDDCYHNVISTVGVPPKSPIPGLCIQRIAEDRWRISVDQKMLVKEIYWEEETVEGRTRTVSYVPLEGTARFNFQMDWIKNIVE